MGSARNAGGEGDQAVVPPREIPASPAQPAGGAGPPENSAGERTAAETGSPAAGPAGEELLSLRHAAKAFGAVQALADGSIGLPDALVGIIEGVSARWPCSRK